MKQDFQKWFADKGDETLRIDYPLNKNSIVLDVGGYKGDWAAKISEKYNCRIFIYEPIFANYMDLVKRFGDKILEEKILVIPYALGGKSEKAEISVKNDATSFFTSKGKKEFVEIVDIAHEFEYCCFDGKRNIEKIDLMKINIEGSEYPLLERMIETNLHHRVTDIQVQFHTFIPEFEQRYANIKKELLKTHHLTYNYPFIWENWRKNDTKI